jgi:hypothetical protein
MELSKYILNSRKDNEIVNEFLERFSHKYDIKKSFEKDIFSEILFKTFLEEHNDGEFEYVFIYGIKSPSDKCLAILGRKEENNMEEDEEFDTHLLYSVPQITDKKQLLSLLKNSKSNTYHIIVLSLWECIKKEDKPKFRDKTNYLFEKKKQERIEKASRINYLKIIDKIFGNIKIDYSKIDNKEYLGKLLKDNYIKIYEELHQINYVNELVQVSDIKFLDFEYDLQRNKLYLDFKLIYKYIENNKLEIEKYNNLLPSVKTFKLKSITDENKLKQIIFEVTLLKSLLGFAHLFSRLFINQDIKYNLINLYNNRIPDDLFSFLQHIKIFRNLLN